MTVSAVFLDERGVSKDLSHLCGQAPISRKAVSHPPDTPRATTTILPIRFDGPGQVGRRTLCPIFEKDAASNPLVMRFAVMGNMCFQHVKAVFLSAAFRAALVCRI